MFRHASIVLLVLVGIALGTPGPAAAAQVSVYRWVDAHGVTHFSQTPPPPGTAGAEGLTLDVPAPATPPQTAEAKAAALQLQALQQRVRDLEQELQARQPNQPAPLPYTPPPAADNDAVLYPAPVVVGTHRWRRHHHRRIIPLKPAKPSRPLQTAPDLYRVPPSYYSTRPPRSRSPGVRPAAPDPETVH